MKLNEKKNSRTLINRYKNMFYAYSYCPYNDIHLSFWLDTNAQLDIARSRWLKWIINLVLFYRSHIVHFHDQDVSASRSRSDRPFFLLRQLVPIAVLCLFIFFLHIWPFGRLMSSVRMEKYKIHCTYIICTIKWITITPKHIRIIRISNVLSQR